MDKHVKIIRNQLMDLVRDAFLEYNMYEDFAVFRENNQKAMDQFIEKEIEEYHVSQSQGKQKST